MTFDDLIDDAIAEAKSGGAFVPALVGHKLVAAVEEAHPEVLTEWLNHHAVRVTVAEISSRLRSERGRAVHAAKAHNFAEAVTMAEEGDYEPLSHFAVVYEVDADHTRLRAGDMTGAHHGFVAGSYETTTNHTRMLAAFHRAMERTVGKRKTSEVMTEDKYHQLLRSILGGDAPEV